MRHALTPLLLGVLLCGASPLLAQDDHPRPRPKDDPTVTPSDDPLAPGAEPDEAPVGVRHFPLDVGRRWTYRVSFRIRPVGPDGGETAESAAAARGEHRMDVYVAEPLRIDGRLVAALEWKLDQDLAQRCYYTVDDGFLRCVKRLQGFSDHIKDFPLDPPQPVVPADPQVGQRWVWEGRAGLDSGQQTFEVLRAEKVTTPAGSFETLVLQAVFLGEDDSVGTMTRWLAPGVGVVKEITEVRTAIQTFRTEGELVRFEAP